MTPSISEDHEEIGGLDDITTLLTILITTHKDMGLDDDHQAHRGLDGDDEAHDGLDDDHGAYGSLNDDDDGPVDLDNHGDYDNLTMTTAHKGLDDDHRSRGP